MTTLEHIMSDNFPIAYINVEYLAPQNNPLLDLNISIEEQEHLLDQKQDVQMEEEQQEVASIEHKKERNCETKIESISQDTEQLQNNWRNCIRKIETIPRKTIFIENVVVQKHVSEQKNPTKSRIYPAYVKEVLEAWYDKDPCPELNDKEKLARETKLTVKQISSWFVTKRRKEGKFVVRKILA